MNAYKNLISKSTFRILWRYREVRERFYLLNKKEIIVVYTMGKVGSTSIYFALKKKFGAKVLFVHRMYTKNINNFNIPFINNNLPIPRYQMAEFIHANLFNRKEVKIITLIREPMSRNISQFFQNFRAYNNGKSFEKISVDEAIHNFIHQYRHEIPENWIHQELLRRLNLQLSELNFCTEKKYSIITKDNFDLLIMRTDLTDTKKEKYLQLFTNTTIKIHRENTHQQKNYHQYYQDFYNKIVIPESIIHQVFDAPYLVAFFTIQEIQMFKKRWLEKLIQ